MLERTWHTGTNFHSLELEVEIEDRKNDNKNGDAESFERKINGGERMERVE